MKNQQQDSSVHHIFPTTPEAFQKEKEKFDSFEASLGTITIKFGKDETQLAVDGPNALPSRKILEAASALIQPFGYMIVPTMSYLLPRTIGFAGMIPLQPTKVVPLETGGSLQIFDFPPPVSTEEPSKKEEDSP